MPIRLKGLLARYDIKQAAWCGVCLQENGRPISRAAGSQILNWQTWPQLTDPGVIKAATEALLRKFRVPESEIKTCWDLEPEDAEWQKPRSASYKRPPRAIDLRPAPEPDFHLEPEMLTQEAKEKFMVVRDPFGNVNDPKDVFLTPQNRYVRETMYQTALNADLLAVIGEVGAGKSTLRRELEDRFKREEKPLMVISVKLIDKERLTADHIAEAIITQLDEKASIPTSAERKITKAEKMLGASLQEGNAHVIFIEEAHDVTSKMLKMLKRYSELEKGMHKLLSIILVGQTELELKLNVRTNPGAREFIYRCGKITLPPLDKHLYDYLKFRFQRVGLNVDDIFDADSIDAMRDVLMERRDGKVRSMTYPLYVNNVSVKAMNAAASLGVPKVNASVIRKLL